MPKKKNTVAKVGKDVVTFSDSGGNRRLSPSKPSVNVSHDSSARGPPPVPALDGLDTAAPDKHSKPKRYFRKRGVAERYGVHERSVDRMKDDGRLPPPDFYIGRFPLWGEDTLDESDRRAALLPRPTRAA